MPRCTNRVTKKRKGVGGRKIIVLTRPNEPDSSVEARPRPKLPLVAYLLVISVFPLIKIFYF